MKKTFFLLMLAFLSASVSARAGESKPVSPSVREDVDRYYPSLMDEAFVVETDEDDIDAGINRVSGHIDRGFASEEYVYQSESHHKAGPLDRQDSFDNSANYGY